MGHGARGAMARPLDELDDQIISLLQHDGRCSTAEIARQLGIPRSTARRRVESLVSDGVITIRAFADSQTIGLPIHVWIELRVTPEEVAQVTRALIELKELRWVGIMSGASNILAEGFFTSNQHLHAFSMERLARIPGIQQVEMHHVLSLEKFAFDWTTMRHAHQDYTLQNVPKRGRRSAAYRHNDRYVSSPGDRA
jgi:DNA-binding Lrp family transcriptional regulator